MALTTTCNSNEISVVNLALTVSSFPLVSLHKRDIVLQSTDRGPVRGAYNFLLV